MPILDANGVFEQGQLVAVRQRRYTVAVVQASTLPTSPLGHPVKQQHLVTLNSIEDEALGETLQVIWELEPGAQTILSCRATQQGIRFTINETARREVLTRLLKLNHERYEEEVRQGLHEKGRKSSARGKRKKSSRKDAKSQKKDDGQMRLF